MEIKDVLTLINAGFTKAEISALLHNDTALTMEAPAQQPEAPAQQPEAPAQQPEAPAQQPEALAQQPDAPTIDLTGLNAAIDKLTHKIQSINIAAAELPQPESTQDKADKILASIINPPRKADK